MYEDEAARERGEAEARPRRDGEPFAGHTSGLTPPSVNVVRRRFAGTRGKLESFPKHEVCARVCGGGCRCERVRVHACTRVRACSSPFRLATRLP